jgi:O-antigen/teichoic acid export membrane protein
MNLLNRLGFNNKSLTLVIASIFTQILPILMSPIFSRIYSPTQFGDFSLFLSYSSICLIFFSGKYELALLLPKYEIDIKRIFQLCLIIIFASFVLINVLIVIYFITIEILNIEFEKVFLLVPIYTVLLAIYQVLSYLLLYLGLFKELSINRFVKSVATVVFILLISFIFSSLNGLIIGSFIGQLLSIIFCYRLLELKTIRFKGIFTIKRSYKFKSLIYEYINFPKFSLPADLVNALISQAPIFILSIYFTKTMVGYYGFVITVIQLPLSIVSSAVLDVFKEMATREYKKYKNCKKAYLRMFFLLIAINIIPMILVTLWGPILFKTIFGDKWETAGHYAQIMIFMLFIKFISSPLSYTFTLMGKQKLDLFLHIGILFFLLLTVIATVYFSLNDEDFLILITSVFSIIYIIYLIKSYEFSKGHVEKVN